MSYAVSWDLWNSISSINLFLNLFWQRNLVTAVDNNVSFWNRAKTFSIKTFSIMPFSIKTFSKMTSSIVALNTIDSNVTLSIRDIQHNDTLYKH